MRMNRLNGCLGFSLIEIVIGVGILLLLAVLLSAGFKTVAASAQNAKCLSNLRQIGTAVTAYTADFNGNILPRYANDVPAGQPRGWPRRLFSLGYVNDVEVFYCPSFFPHNSKEATKPITTDASEAYGMRAWAAPGSRLSAVGTGSSYHKPTVLVEKPSEFFIVADSVWLAAGWFSQGYGITPGSAGQFVHLRHRKMANALFLDGHVEAKPESYFKSLHSLEEQGAYMENRELGVTDVTDLEELKKL